MRASKKETEQKLKMSYKGNNEEPLHWVTFLLSLSPFIPSSHFKSEKAVRIIGLKKE